MEAAKEEESGEWNLLSWAKSAGVHRVVAAVDRHIDHVGDRGCSAVLAVPPGGIGHQPAALRGRP